MPSIWIPLPYTSYFLRSVLHQDVDLPHKNETERLVNKQSTNTRTYIICENFNENESYDCSKGVVVGITSGGCRECDRNNFFFVRRFIMYSIKLR